MHVRSDDWRFSCQTIGLFWISMLFSQIQTITTHVLSKSPGSRRHTICSTVLSRLPEYKRGCAIVLVSLFLGWLSTHPTSPRSLRVASSLCSTTRPWSVISLAFPWPTPPCLTKALLLLRPCSCATGSHTLTWTWGVILEARRGQTIQFFHIWEPLTYISVSSTSSGPKHNPWPTIASQNRNLILMNET